MSRSDGTYIGSVASVIGSVVTVRLRQDQPSALIFVDGESYRLGQIGAFLRLPLGYSNLFGVCTQVGAAAAPQSLDINESSGYRWLTLVLFGESIGSEFERGVSQYPTVDDEVHLVTRHYLDILYASIDVESSIEVGTIASSSGIPGRISIGPFVNRHAAIVGSTGSGKSNTVGVILEALAHQGWNSARVLVIDPHGEYTSCVEDNGYVFRVDASTSANEKPLVIPFWALPFDEIRDIAFGSLQPASEASIRDEVVKLKVSANRLLESPAETERITADTPIPFSIKKLWFELDDFERRTYKTNAITDTSDLDSIGDALQMKSNIYPKPGLGSSPPFKNPRPRQIDRQLEMLRSRIMDGRYRFLFELTDDYEPDLDGKVSSDLCDLVRDWVGHDRMMSVLDMSGVPSEILSPVVGSVLRVVYDVLFWAAELAVSGKNQPLLIVIDEAHLFIPDGQDSAVHRILSRIAKEGRKYGVGLLIVTQRPTEVSSAILSQCGTMIAMRLLNERDCATVKSSMPDDLSGLTSMLPSLRTGEALVAGEGMPIPSRVRFKHAAAKPTGSDPDLVNKWKNARPEGIEYKEALIKWRNQSV